MWLFCDCLENHMILLGLLVDWWDDMRFFSRLLVVGEVDILLACSQIKIELRYFFIDLDLSLLLFVGEFGQLLFFVLSEFNWLDWRCRFLGDLFGGFDLPKSLVVEVFVLDYFLWVFLKFFGSRWDVFSNLLIDLVTIDSCIDIMFDRFEGEWILLKIFLIIEVVEKCLAELLGLVGFHFVEDVLGDFPVVLV